ncbi:hypothetical protein M3J09_010223 [Ascochyta lentis]
MLCYLLCQQIPEHRLLRHKVQRSPLSSCLLERDGGVPKAEECLCLHRTLFLFQFQYGVGVGSVVEGHQESVHMDPLLLVLGLAHLFRMEMKGLPQHPDCQSRPTEIDILLLQDQGALQAHISCPERLAWVKEAGYKESHMALKPDSARAPVEAWVTELKHSEWSFDRQWFFQPVLTAMGRWIAVSTSSLVLKICMVFP